MELLNTNGKIITLANYSMSDYIVARSTPEALAHTRERLGHDLAPLPVELSAVEGLIYEMPDTSVPVEMEGSIPVVIPQPVVQQDDTVPSPYAMPRRPPKVYPYIEPTQPSSTQAEKATNQSEQINHIQHVPEQYQASRAMPELRSSLHPADAWEVSPVSSTSQLYGTNQSISPLSPAVQPMDPNQTGEGHVSHLDGVSSEHRKLYTWYRDTQVVPENTVRRSPSNPVLVPKASSDSTNSWATTISPPPTVLESPGSASTPTFGSILGEPADSPADQKPTNTKERKSNKFRRMFSS
jgi:hypothetical protein